MRLLLVEDSKRLQRSLGTGLRRAGYALDITGDGAEAAWQLGCNEYDAVVLDLMLPSMDGLTVLRKYREHGGRAGVLILTARDAVSDRVDGLRAGADDYLVKPFAFEELLARIEALIRRNHGVRTPARTIGDLRIDLSMKQAWRGGEALQLAPREFALLELLVLKANEVVSRSEIERHIYDERAEPMSNVVDAAICALRRKVERPGSPALIRTRRGMGYLIEDGSSWPPSEDN